MILKPIPGLLPRWDNNPCGIPAPVGAWVMNEGSGEKIYDASGNGNDGVATSVAAMDIGWAGGALKFSGGNLIQGMVFPALTFGHDDNWSIILKEEIKEATNEIVVGEYNTDRSFIYNRPGTRIRVKSSGNINYDFAGYGSYENVHDLAISTNGANNLIEIYADGCFHASNSSATSSGIIFNSIGGAFTIPTYCFQGKIWFVYIFNQALTATQIAYIHQHPYYAWEYPELWEYYTAAAGGVILTVAELAGTNTLDIFSLTQKHAITAQELLSTGLLDNTILTQKHLLVLQELLSSGVLDSLVVIQKHLLAVQEIGGAGTVDNAVLTQKHLLVLQELLSAGTLDNIELIVALLLNIADLISSGNIDSNPLTQKHLLAIQEMLSSGNINNIELSLAILLIVAELLSNGSLDAHSLTQKHNITIQQLLSAGSLDTSTITQKHILAAQSLLSAGALDALNLIAATLLAVADLVSNGALDSKPLAQKHILTIQEVLSAGNIEGINLTTGQLLIIQELLSSGLISNINFSIATGLVYISLSQSTEYGISLSEFTEYGISLSQSTEYGISLSAIGGGIC